MPTNYPIPEQLIFQALNPQTDQQTLFQLASNYPQLYYHIAANPNTYPELLEWLSRRNDPVLEQIIALRSQHLYGAEALSRVQQIANRNYTPPSFLPEGESNHSPNESQNVTQEDSPGRNWGVIVLSLLTVLAVIVIGIVVYGVVTSKYQGNSDNADTVTTAEQSATASIATSVPESTAGEQSESSRTAFPAPSGSLTAEQITLPSQNIGCTLQAETVTCSINNRTWSENGYPDCPANTSATVSSNGQETKLDCSNPAPITGGVVIEYGQSVQNDQVACTISTNGAKCWNINTGHGFTIRSQDWTSY